jgi:hypothetical protein
MKPDDASRWPILSTRYDQAFAKTFTHMPKWLKGMIGPTLLVWLYGVAYAIVEIGAGESETLSGGADLVSRLALAWVISIWVLRDAHKRGRRLFYDYGMFVFFCWPIVAPVYLFQTRGVRAFLTLLCFIGIWLLVGISIAIANMLSEGFSP